MFTDSLSQKNSVKSPRTIPEITAKIIKAPKTVKMVPAIVIGTARLRDIPYLLIIGVGYQRMRGVHTCQ